MGCGGSKNSAVAPLQATNPVVIAAHAAARCACLAAISASRSEAEAFRQITAALWRENQLLKKSPEANIQAPENNTQLHSQSENPTPKPTKFRQKTWALCKKGNLSEINYALMRGLDLNTTDPDVFG